MNCWTTDGAGSLPVPTLVSENEGVKAVQAELEKVTAERDSARRLAIELLRELLDTGSKEQVQRVRERMDALDRGETL